MALAKVVIKGENQLTGAVNGAKQDMGALEKASQKMGETLKKAFAFTAIVATVKKLGDTCRECFAEFSQANRSYKQLALSMNDQSAYTSLIGTIDKLSTQTLESKDGIESMVAELAALGKSAEEIDQISSAAVYLSNVTGKDLNSSMTTLLNTYRGTTTQLNKLGVDTSDLTKTELENGAAVDLVIGKFKDLSESMAEADTSQHITNIKNTLGDIKQQIGGIIDYNIKPLVTNIDNALRTSFSNIQNIINYVGAVIANFPQVAGEALKLVGSMIHKIFSWEFVSDAIDTVFSNMGTLANAFGSMFEKAIPDIARFALLEASAAVVKITGIAIKAVETILEKILNFPLVKEIVTGFLSGLSTISEGIENIVENLSASLARIGNDIVNAARRIGLEISSGALKILGTILSKIEDVINAVFSALKGLGNHILSDIISMIAWIVEKAETALEGIVNVFARSKLGQWLGAKEIDVNLGSEKLRETASKDILGGDTSISLGSKALLEASENLAETAQESVTLFHGLEDVNLGSQALKEAARNLGSKEIKVNLGGDAVLGVADTLGENAKASVQAARDGIGEIMSTARETISEIKDNNQGLLDRQFGEMLDGFTDSIETIIAPELEAIEIAADVTNKTVAKTQTAVQTINTSLQNGTFLEKLSNKVAAWIDKKTGKEETDEDGNPIISASSISAVDKVFGFFTKSLGEAGNFVTELTSNMATMGPVLGAIVTALKYVFEGFGEVISGTLNEFIQYGLEPLREIGRVVGEVLLPLFDALMPLVEESARFLIGLFDSVGIVLKPIIQMIGTLLTPTLSVLTNVLHALEPVIKVLAKVLVTVTGTIQYVVQVLQHWVAVVMNWLAGLDLMGRRPFKGLAMNDPGAPGKYGEYIQNKWGEVDAAFEAAATTGTTATQTAVSTAGYQGATNITINIYQQAPVVGDGGMRQFASMIRDEFSNLDYYGVTA